MKQFRSVEQVRAEIAQTPRQDLAPLVLELAETIADAAAHLALKPRKRKVAKKKKTKAKR